MFPNHLCKQKGKIFIRKVNPQRDHRIAIGKGLTWIIEFNQLKLENGSGSKFFDPDRVMSPISGS